MNNPIYLLATAAFSAVFLVQEVRAGEAEPRLVSVRKIWDQAPHNAFTDLIRRGDTWYCVFREGQGHVSLEGKIRVLSSKDGERWESAALLSSPDADTPDLRDAKITLTPDGRLMLVSAAAFRENKISRHQTFVWFSQDGKEWGDPRPVGEKDNWLWRIVWNKDTAYGVGYNTGPDAPKLARLYSSRDGVAFTTLAPTLFGEGYPNESGLLFLPDGRALCLLRRDAAPATGQLGIAEAPYTQWTWKDLGRRIGGPQMIQLPDGRLFAAVRLYDGKVRTSLCRLDAEQGTLKEVLPFPSGGDTSYPGMVWHDGLLWISYYSSHEGKTSIYLAKVKL